MNTKIMEKPPIMSKPPAIGPDLKKVTSHEFVWIWVGTVILILVSFIVTPGIIRPSSIAAMLPFAAILAIVAVGQTIVIQQRGLDMSLPGIVTISGLLLAFFSHVLGTIFPAVLATLAVAAGIGTINGLLISRVNITPIVATLATNAILLGAVQTLSGGSPMSVPAGLAIFSHFSVLGIPTTIILAFAFIVSVSVVTKRTLGGQRFVAVGANSAAASAAGIPVLAYQIGTYTAASICYSVAGMLFAGFIGSASQTAGMDYLLPSIAAVVVGGTPFSGGRGSVIASGVAALFLTLLDQMVLALGAAAAIQLLVQASAIVVAVSIRHVPAVWRHCLRWLKKNEGRVVKASY